MANIEKYINAGVTIATDDCTAVPLKYPIIVNDEILQLIKEKFYYCYNYSAYSSYVIAQKLKTISIPFHNPQPFINFYRDSLVDLYEIDKLLPLAIKFYTQAIKECLNLPRITFGTFHYEFKHIKNYKFFSESPANSHPVYLAELFQNFLCLSDFIWGEYRIPEENLLTEYNLWLNLAIKKNSKRAKK